MVTQEFGPPALGAPALPPGWLSEEEYAQQVEYVRLFLAGKDDQVLTQLIARMEKSQRRAGV